MRYRINQSENFVTVIWICFVYSQQGGLHENEIEQNFVAYFVFQYLMNSIYLCKLELAAMFLYVIFIYHFFIYIITFSIEKFNLK